MLIRFGLLFVFLLEGSALLTADILYSVTNLGTLPGSSGSTGVGLNSFGQVVGYSSFPPDSFRAFLYSSGQMTDLGTLGGTSASAYAINNAGQVAGYAFTAAGVNHAFLYSNGQMTDLGTIGNFGSTAYGINDIGQVVGSSSNYAFLYTNGRMTNLGTLPGDSNSEAHGINNSGQIAGVSGGHAFLYSNGQMADLGNLGACCAQANAINNAGQVTGDSFVPTGTYHAFLYSNGQMLDLGTLPGNNFSDAYSINSVGQVVGTSYYYSGLTGFPGISGDNTDNATIQPSVVTPGPLHAFLYSNGQMSDLNNFIDPRLNITLSAAVAINDSGQIVANDSGNHVYLLTPAPEPGTLALFGIALCGLGAWLRAHKLR